MCLPGGLYLSMYEYTYMCIYIHVYMYKFIHRVYTEDVKGPTIICATS